MRRLLIIVLLILNACQKPIPPFETEKPDETRFTKTTLVEKLDEPMEMEVLQDGKVLFIERKGKIRLFDPAAEGIKEVGFIDVYFEAEDGLLGLAKDPGFAQNNWIYLYYSPVGDRHINRLSRFTLVDELLDMGSEIIMLEVPQFRGCCHSGGSIEFDSKGNLFLSLGDDSTPFESDNYNPIDERPGRPENVDAQRSSANSNDLRGGIIRITPQADGTYTIPEGNLFPVGTPHTRPELYVMGNRNPFRISVDQKTGILYWGEVGPDASVDSLQRGPMGYDEVNQAKAAGFFGWPYFIADNKPYWHYDFEKQQSNYEFEVASPINKSPNNTGVEQLPPAQPAFIWYPYGESPDFPLVGKGGRNAMAGPVYYKDMFPANEVKFPGYYNGKLFIYDWMRNWIFTVTMDQEHNFVEMEQFMPSTVFVKPVDMQFGPDGSLYILEYGTYWSAQNDDSGIYKIEFSAGNRKPIAKASADQLQGAAPLKVSFNGEKCLDHDPGDQLTYSWDFGVASKSTSNEVNPTFVFDKPGNYNVVLTVTDQEGLQATTSLSIAVGNEPPVVEIELEGNRSFYWGQPEIAYAIKVNDLEDGSLENGSIASKDVEITWGFLKEGFDRVEEQHGHQTEEPTPLGKSFIVSNGCNACHAVENASVGPSYQEVANKYGADPGSVGYLTQKITAGGSGVWGERLMPSHAHVPGQEIEEMVEYILSLSTDHVSSAKTRLPVKGKLKLDRHDSNSTKGTYWITASYKDQSINNQPGILRREQIVLRHPMVLAADADVFQGTAKANNQNSRLIKFTENKAYLGFLRVDLSGISRLILTVDPNKKTGKFLLKTGSPEGNVIGESVLLNESLRPVSAKGRWFDIEIPISKLAGQQDIYLVFETETGVDIWGAFLLNTVLFGKE
jgi:cytochrome c